jgi:hypothetical protein
MKHNEPFLWWAFLNKEGNAGMDLLTTFKLLKYCQIKANILDRIDGVWAKMPIHGPSSVRH